MEKVCQLWDKVLDSGAVYQLQCWLILEYCQIEHLERREGAKTWVQNFSAKCRTILEQWVPDEETLKQQLYG